MSDANCQKRWSLSWCFCFIYLCLFGSIVAVIWYGVLMINSNELSIGELFTFIYLVFIGASVGGMADIYAKLQKAIETEHLMDILEEEKEIIPTFSADAVKVI